MLINAWRKWLNRLAGLVRGKRIGKQPPARRRSLRLAMEMLEDRVTPSGLQPGALISQPDVAPSTPVNTEGQSVLAGEVLLQFTDTTGPSDLATLTATITWGDGSPDTVVTSASTTTATITNPGGGATFQVNALVTGAHVYEEAPAGALFTVLVTSSNPSDSPNTTGASTQLNSGNAVADAVLTDTTTPQGTVNGVEGNTLTNVVLATFDDANASAPASDFPPANLTVNYTGSPAFVGTPTYAVQANGVPSGGFSHWKVVATSLTFAEAGNFTVSSVHVADVGGSTVTTANGPTFAVSDAPLRIDAGLAFSATEGVPTNPVLATFTDANPGDHSTDFSTAITWGDGTGLDTSSGVISYNSGTHVYTVTGSHSYGEDGTYFASVRVKDADGFAVDTGVGLNGSGAVVTAAVQTAGAWYPDRYPPSNFVGGLTTLSRTGVIDETISAADADGSRPPAYNNNSFYDFQGRKYDLPASTTYVTMDLYVPSSWTALNQQDLVDTSRAASNGSVASLWGTAVDSSNNVVDYSIIGFNNLGTNNSQSGSPGFQVFDTTNGWTNVTGFSAYDQWYQLSYAVVGGNFLYFVNGNLVYTDTVPSVPAGPGRAVAVSNEILQGYNGGNTTAQTYDIFWNPVQDTQATVAEAANGIVVTASPVTATEGTGTGSITVATFTDGPNTDAPGNYTATVDWGDGHIHSGLAVTQPGGSGTNYVVTDSNTYAEDGSYPVTVTITETGVTAGTGTGSTTANVADAPLADTTQAQPALNGTEGTAFTNVVLATFDDANTSATVADFPPANITVNYTGSPSVAPTYAVQANGVPSGGFSHWKVVATSLTFAEAGNFTVSSVHVADVGGSTVTTANGPTFAVSDAPLRIDAGLAFSATEGVPTNPVLATFTDANPGDHSTDFSTAITWGDGTGLDTSSGVISYNSGTHVYTVTGSHSYGEDGTYFASVRVKDADGFAVDTGVGLNGSGAVVTAAVQTAGAWYPDRYPPSNFVGGLTTLSRTGVIDETISAADADGSRPPAYNNNSFYDFQGRKYDLPASTTYVTMDLYVPSSWTALNQQDLVDTSRAASNGSVASLWGTAVDSSNNVVDYSIIGFNNLGTNNSQSGSPGFQVFDTTNGWTNVTGFSAYDQWYQLSYAVVGGNFLYFVNGNLVYTDTVPSVPAGPGRAVAVSNEILQGYNGGNTTAQTYDIFWNPVQDTQATVAEAANGIVVTASPVTATEGTGTGSITVATFTDGPNTDAPGNYTATVDWGDGHIHSGLAVTQPGGSGTNYVVTDSNTYAEDGSYPVTVTITETGVTAGTGTGSTTANVAEAVNGIVVTASPVTATEGTTTGSITVATFTDGPNTDAPGNCTATVDWGDGHIHSGLAVTQPGGSGTNYVVTDSNTYAEDGSYPVTVTITETGVTAGTGTGSTTANVAEAANGIVVTASPVTATEGTTTGSITVATFTDGPNTDAPGNYTATVDWGDGHIHSGLAVTQPGGSGTNYVVTDSNTYAEDGSYPVTVTITETGVTAGTGTGSTTANVAEAVNGIVVTASPVTATEGTTTGSITVATFTDGPNTDAPGNCTATVNWGDGNTDSGLPVTQSASGQPYVVTASHTYAEDGHNLPVSVTITETGITNGTGTGTTTADVAEAASGIVVTANPVTATEGTTTGSITVATFSDGPNTDPVGNYTASVNWGDGNTDSGLPVTQSASGQPYVVTASHTYAEDGHNLPVSVTITETGITNGTGTGTTTADVAEAASGIVVTANPVTATEGTTTGPITVATFSDGPNTDPVGNYTASVNWGDGNTDSGLPVTQSASGQPYVVTASHTYAEDGHNLPVSVTITETGITNGTGTGTTTADVAEAASGIVVTANPVTATEGTTTGSITVATFSDGPNTDPVGNYTASVNWGDGNTDSGLPVTQSASGQPYVVTDSHTYAEEGSYPVTVTITETGITNGTGSNASTATVAEQQLTSFVVAAPPASTVEGTNAGPITVATFTDLGGAEPNASDPTPNTTAGHYTATIDWGDGTGSHAGTVVPTGGNNFAIQDNSHTFTEEGTHTLTVTVKHETAGLLTQTANYTVSDAAVVATPGPTITATEGGSTNLVLLAKFTDPGGPEALTEYDATVTWGDSSTPDNTTDAAPNIFIVQAGGNNTNLYFVEGTHAYTEESPTGGYTVTTTIHHHSELSPNPVDTVSTQTANVTDPSVNATGNFSFTAVEGTMPTNPQTVATFTDPGGAELTGGAPTTGEYTATINWGDSTPTTTGSIAYSGGTFTVTGNHLYTEEGSFTISVLIQHGTSSNVTVTSTATVTDPAVTLNSPALTFNAAEGASSLVQPVATFTDSGGPESIAEYTATIDWGDSTPVTSGTITVSSGTFTVSGSHQYAEESATGTPYAINVMVNHGTASAISANTANATVTDPAVQATGATLTGTEGTALAGGQVLATFTDPAGAEATSAYSVQINPGSGFVSLPAADISYSAVSNTFTVTLDAATAATITYAEEGNHAIAVQISHDLATAVTVTSTAVIADQQISVPVVATLPTGQLEGALISAITGIASFTDPAGIGSETATDFTATIHWGDGGTDVGTVVQGTGGAYTVNAPGHPYAEEGTYSVTVTVQHDALAPVTSAGQSITIADQPISTPVVTAPSGVLEGTATSAGAIVATFTDPAGYGVETAAGDFTATIDWGDGSPTAVGTVVATSGGSYNVTAPAHGYVEEGSYTLTVTVKHDALAAVSGSASISIAEQQITTPVAANVPANGLEGAVLGPITGIATFSDPAGTGTELPAGDFTATVQWGDGSSAATVVSLGSGNYRVDAPTHTYAEEGTYSVTVTVQHAAEAALTSTNTVSITVADQQLTNLASANLPTTAQENVAVPAVTGIATFTDPAGVGVEPLSDFTATIHWGDSNTDVGTITSLGSGNYRVDAPTHTYAEEGSYTVNVTLSHDGQSALTTPNQTITVADQQITTPVATSVPASGSENVAIGPFSNLASFSDPAGVESDGIAAYTATIHWGDGNTDTGTIVSDGSGNYHVSAPTHPYAEEGTYSVTVTVQHDALASVTSNAQSITIADQPISTPVVTAPSGVLEGTATTAGTVVASFTDPAGYGVETAAGDFTATLDWGDGSPTAAGTVVATTAGSYNVTAPAHGYVEEGSYTLTVTVKHDALAAVSGSASVTIAEQQITTPVAANVPATALEGAALAPITGIATFTDPAGTGTELPAGDFTATVHWGDGSSAGTVVSLGGGNYRVDAPAHTYAEEATYSVTVSVQHAAEAALTSTNTVSITVNDQQLTNLASANLPTAGQENVAVPAVTGMATFTDPAGVGVEPLSDFTATVNWGDGSSAGTVVSLGNGNYRVDAPTHTYAEEGSYTVNVTLSHDGQSALTTPNQTITVADQQITTPVATSVPASGSENVAIGPFSNLASFSDPAGVESDGIAAYTATIHWGDGNTDTGTIVSDGSGNYHVSAPTHPYAEEGTYSVTVTVQHDALASVTSNAQSITIADQPISTPVVTAPSGVLEGTATTAGAMVASFTDPAGYGVETAAGDFTATLDWGDGSPTAAGTVVATTAGSYNVTAPAHGYVEEGSYTLTVTVKHDALAAVSGSASVTIAEQQITTPVAANVPATALEGAALAPITGIATFTDPAGTGTELPAGDFTATVHWGDGSSAGTVVSLGGGNYRVDAPGHTYAEEGAYSVTVSVQHAAQTALTSNGLSITVNDQQLTNLASANLPTAGQENVAVPAVTGMATFTDPAGVGVEPLSDFTATVNWGDGSSPGTVVSLGNGNYRVDAPPHTYAEEGRYTVNVTLSHDGQSALTTPNQTITVADQQITTPVATSVPASGSENVAISGITGIASFTDPAGIGSETATDFTATIHWGDGGTDGGTVVQGSGGAYTVNAPAHTYAEEGTYSVTVTVQHDALASVTSNAQSITIADQPISTPVVTAPSGVLEGTATTAGTVVASFTDPAGYGVETAAGDFTATLDWGDGSPTAAGTVVATTAGSYNVTAPAHGYVEEGSYTLTVTVKHDALAAVSGSASVTIAEQQITTPVAANVPATALEGAALAPITGIATFTDPAGTGTELPAGDFTATVHWGDGSSAGTVVSLGGGNYRVDAPAHTYAEEATYSVTVSVQHAAEAALTSTNTVSITVNDQQLTNLASANLPTAGQENVAVPAVTGMATFTDPAGVGVEPLSDFTATVNWGDGSSAGTVVSLGNGNYRVDAPTHTYAEEGRYTVNVTLSHDGQSALTTPNQTITVADQQITTPVATSVPASGSENVAIGPFSNLASFSDPAGVESDGIAAYTATIHWGDGNTDTGTIVSDGSGNYHVSAPTHPYAEEGTYSVTVTVQHDALASVTSNAQSIIIADQPISTPAVTAPSGVLEGTATTAGAMVASFTDPAGYGVETAAGDFTATLDWGDGSPTAAGTVVATTAGSYNVTAPAHGYVEEGSYTLTVTVKHDALAAVSGSASVTIAEQQITTPVAANVPATALEGAALAPITGIATFTDPAGTGTELPAGDFTATVHWGDGSSAGTVVSLGGGNYRVDAPGHTYAEEGAYSVTVSVQHAAQTALTSNGLSITVNDQQLTNLASANLPTAGQENVAVPAVTGMATFTDPAGVGVEPLSDFTATVNWGDGSSPGTVVSLGNGNYRVDAPPHTYAEEGTYTVNVTLKHDLLPALTTPNQTITVADQQFTSLATAALPAGKLEGTGIGAITGLATFTDPAGSEAVGDYTATIHWGDNTTASGTVVDLSGGNFRVDTTGHTYAEEGTYTVSVTLTHDLLPAVTTPSQAITIADPAVATVSDVNTNVPAGVLEGQSTGAIADLATFTDPGGQGQETASDFTAVIHWGDTTTAPGTVVSLGSSNYRVDAPAHTYAEDGTYAVTVTVTHDQTTPATSAGQNLVIGEAAVSMPVVAAVSATEGTATGAIPGLATFSDASGTVAAGDTFTAVINWGDSKPAAAGTVVSLGNGSYRVDAPSHTYTESGSFPVSVTVTHDTVVGTPGTGTASVADVQLTGLTVVSASLPSSPAEGAVIAPITDVATFTDPAASAVDPTGASEFTATVNWGDGMVTAATVVGTATPGSYQVNDPTGHTYVEEGTYTLSVTVQHNSLAPVASTGHNLVVADQQLTNLATATLPIGKLEGAGIGAIANLAQFTDPAGVGVEPLSDFTATIHWGDNITSVGTVVALGSGNYRVDAPDHSYAEEGSYGVTVTLTHDSLAAVTTPSQTITIADQQLTSLASANLPATGQEGASLPVILGIATFTDPAGSGTETASDFTATIQWGDTTTSAGSIAALGGGNYRVDAPAHTYVEEGSFTVTVTVQHDAVTPVLVSNTQTIAIADQQLTSLTSSNLPPTAQEGAALAAVSGIATFTDPAGTGAEVASDFTATIHWGDSTTSTGTVVSTGGGSYRVDAPTHTYAEEGIYTVNVTLTHDALAALTTPNQTIAVADQQLTTLASANLPATGQENSALAVITGLATFTDPAGAEATTDYHATITWGDGSSSAGTVVSTGDGNLRIDAPRHTYTEEGSYNVTVTLSHDLLPVLTTPSQTIAIADQQISTPVAANLPAHSPKDAALPAIQGMATFTDPAGVGVETPAGDFTATIHWGDSTTATGTVVALGGGNYRVDAPAHTYAQAGTLTVTVTVQHDALAAVTSNLQSIVVIAPSTAGVFEFNTVTWKLRNSNSPGAPDIAPFQYGSPDSVPVTGDWNGDHTTTIGVVDLVANPQDPNGPRLLEWKLHNSNAAGAPDLTFTYGQEGDIPVTGDWTGDGTTTVGVFNPNTDVWKLRNSNSSGAPDFTFTYGQAGDVPVTGDWDGNGTTTIGVVHPNSMTWLLRNSNSAGAPDYTPFAYGQKGDVPLAGDWNGDGVTTIGIFSPSDSAWKLRNSISAGGPDIAPFQYGAFPNQAKPVTGTYGTGNLLVAADGLSTGASTAPSLTEADLQTAKDAALARLQQVGVSATVLGKLANAQFDVSSGQGAVLGKTFAAANRVVINANAAGHGWFIDPTPLQDQEFTLTPSGALVARPGTAAVGHMDLLTVVLHEMGHLAGLPDVSASAFPGDLMDGLLSEGTRLTAALDTVFADGQF